MRIGVPAAFAARRLREKSKTVDEVVERFFDAPMHVEIVDESETNSEARVPTQQPGVARRRRQEALNDPGVSRALEILGGEILEIRPLGEGR